MSEYKDINDNQYKILKYMYENEKEIAKLKGYTIPRIEKKAECKRHEAKPAILKLEERGFLSKWTEKWKHKVPSNLKKGSYPVSDSIRTQDKYMISQKGIDYYKELKFKMQSIDKLAKEIDNDIEKLDNATEEVTYEIFDKYHGNVDNVNAVMTYSEDFNIMLKSALEGFRLFGYKNKSEFEQPSKETPCKGDPRITVGDINAPNSNIIIGEVKESELIVENSSKEESSNFWKLAGRISLILGIIVAIIAIVAFINDKINF
jgi:hypothetical protein